MRNRWGIGILLLCGVAVGFTHGEESRDAAARGRDALLTRSYTPALWALNAYDDAWKQWDIPEKPGDYARAFREHYGLHVAPYPNDGLPMGIRQAQGLLGKGLASDCLLCHGGSILGKSYVGLGNSALDMHSLYDDLARASGLPSRLTYPYSNVRGTTEAGAFAVTLLDYRDAQLNLRVPVKLPFRTDLCEDPPAWWLLKRKKTMYLDGGSNARAVRSIMQFMLTPLNTAEHIKKQEPVFRDVQAFILSIEPPKYPFPIEESLAAQGKVLFEQTCARCHGTYGPNGAYPNKIVPLEEIGTDPTRATGFSAESLAHYNQTWFAQELGPDGKPYLAEHPAGYQAPPLDGVWATAPYLHNASVPTIYHVLNSKTRPQRFTRSYRTDETAYDLEKLGWKFTAVERVDANLSDHERRKVYDTTQPGRGNRGHTFGDKFSEAERKAVIEYLKSL